MIKFKTFRVSNKYIFFPINNYDMIGVNVGTDRQPNLSFNFFKDSIFHIAGIKDFQSEHIFTLVGFTMAILRIKKTQK